jgi:hypothetical protein
MVTTERESKRAPLTRIYKHQKSALMEKINFRFLNYKHYDTFLRDLNDNVTLERPYGAIR